jgi:carboxymethylenebutenolidase
MGEMVTFASNGGTAEGYLAKPASGKGPGVIVIQEWWGLNDNIKNIADRFAAEGYLALAPDLYHGKVTAEPDEAGKIMMELKMEGAAKDMSGAYDFLKNHESGTGKVGSVGSAWADGCRCSSRRSGRSTLASSTTAS